MKKMCCGVLVTTPYCPSCGEKFGAVGLAALLVHLRTNQYVAERWKEQLANSRPGKEYPHVKKRIEKWKDWADQLEALLKTEAR